MSSNRLTNCTLAASGFILLALALASCQAFDWGRGMRSRSVGTPYLATPTEITAPLTATAGRPTTATVEYEEGQSFKLIKSRASLDPVARSFTIELYFQKYEPVGGSFIMIVYHSTKDFTVTFPTPGEWTIRSGGKSVPITVLPSEEAPGE